MASHDEDDLLNDLLGELERTGQFVLSAGAEFGDLALGELREADARAQVSGELAPGVLLVNGARGFGALARGWIENPPIFVRHICPVLSVLELAQESADVDALAMQCVATFAPLIEAGLTFSVQTRLFGDFPYKPFDINSAVSSLLVEATGAELDVRGPEQVVSIVCGRAADAGGAQAYIGLSPTLYNLSDWAGGMRRFARDEKQVSRSEFKLLEAIEIFGLHLEPRSVALDLGASPGGWTRILRLHQQYVTALDPGELHPSVAADAGVRHKRMTAQAYLQDDPDRFDLIVNDMRMDARDSARLMNEYAACLYREGRVLMTLKLPEVNPLPVLEHALRILEERYRVARVKHLFHNRSEVTALLIPRSNH